MLLAFTQEDFLVSENIYVNLSYIYNENQNRIQRTSSKLKTLPTLGHHCVKFLSCSSAKKSD